MGQNAELKKLGEDVRKQGYEKGAAGRMKDLVFDSETGTFKAVEHVEGVSHEGDIVTEMTREGFAFN